MNDTLIEDIRVKVSIARKQPMLEVATGNSPWGLLAVQNSVKGSYRDKRSQVTYKEDIFGKGQAVEKNPRVTGEQDEPRVTGADEKNPG
ncbi:hypothetical protein FKM82_019165 [Ascaphus truei]